MQILEKIKSGDCLERVDAGYFVAKTKVAVKTKKLKELAYVFGGKRLAKGDYFTEEDTRFKYLRVTDIKDLSISLDNLFCIDRHVHESIKQYITREGDIVITIAGTIGEVTLVPKLNGIIVNLTENAAKLVTLKDAIDKEYLLLALNTNYVKTQAVLETIQTGVPKLALERIYELSIPVVDNPAEIVSFRRKIVATLDKLKSEEKELKLKIDPYLYEKISIQKFPNKQVSFGSKDFTDRIDFLYVNAQKESKLKFSSNLICLRDIVYSFKKGNSPKPEEIQEEIACSNESFPLMRIQDISKENRIQFPFGVFVRKYIKGFSYSFLELNDFIFVITGATIGKIAFLKEKIPKVMLGSDMIAVRFIKDICNPEFMYFLFNTAYYQEQIKTSITGQTNGHLDPEDILRIKIPNLTIIEQDNIVKEVNDKFIHNISAKEKLITEIKEKAGELIENLILGKINIREAEKEINTIYKLF
jgi:type I restriction enzyme, S subunit